MLSEGEEELRSKYHYGKEPPSEQFQEDFDSFKNSYNKKKSWDLEKVDVTKERRMSVPSNPKSLGPATRI